ncbi:MAG: hypothetical protein ACI9YH_001763 [Colwellia sp.]|jgi:hypothetical protein
MEVKLPKLLMYFTHNKKDVPFKVMKELYRLLTKIGKSNAKIIIIAVTQSVKKQQGKHNQCNLNYLPH